VAVLALVVVPWADNRLTLAGRFHLFLPWSSSCAFLSITASVIPQRRLARAVALSGSGSIGSLMNVRGTGASSDSSQVILLSVIASFSTFGFASARLGHIASASLL
jgi:hypothetical protein